MSVQRDHGTGNACGKAILAGEHFVLYGAPALAIPLPALRLHTDLRQTDGATLSVRNGEHLIGESGVIELVSRAFSMMEVASDSWDVCIRSNIPLGCGLGSSAALSVALLRGLSNYTNTPLSPERLNALAFELEKVSHGAPSGVDNAVVSMERAVWFQMGESPRPIELPPMCLVLGDTGIRGSTVEAVNGVRQRAVKRPDWLKELAMDARMETISLRAELEAGRLTTAGDLLCRAHVRLQELGVSTEMLDLLQKGVMEAGALGAKLTGAGHGGCILALVEEPKASTVAAALTELGARETWIVNTGGSP